MACECKTSKTRAIVQLDGKAQVIRNIKVTVSSECSCIEQPEPKPKVPEPKPKVPEPEPKVPDRIDFLSAIYESIGPRSHGFRLSPPKLCYNQVNVSLENGTTVGLKITEVTLGNDTFAASIAVGDSEHWAEICGDCNNTNPADCEEKPVSVKIEDAAGKVVATIDDFKACRCKT